jgi:hypothetical protein
MPRCIAYQDFNGWERRCESSFLIGGMKVCFQYNCQRLNAPLLENGRVEIWSIYQSLYDDDKNTISSGSEADVDESGVHNESASDVG